MSVSTVQVICRFRPFVEREVRLGVESSEGVFETTRNRVVVNTDNSRLEFPVAKCLGTDASQYVVYKELAEGFMLDFFQGYNVTLFAYGQTGSGKSFSMFGDFRKADLRGLVPRCCETIFKTIKSMKNSQFSITCAYVEIYQEVISDLLDPERTGLEIHETPSRGLYVKDLSWEPVTSLGDIYRLIALGDAHKVKRQTNMNQQSSRSHCNFCIRLNKTDMETGTTASTTLNLVDLAGSERISKSGVTGLALEEAKKINLSLTTLSQCINGLVDGKVRLHIPYRQSKLTRLLQDSLGGNSKTSMLVACSPHVNNIEETVNSLRFAQRCANVKNCPVANIKLSVEELQELLATLRAQLEQSIKSSGYSRPQMFDVAVQTDADDEKHDRLNARLSQIQTEIDFKRAEIEQCRAAQLDTKKRINVRRVQISSLAEFDLREADLQRRSMSTMRLTRHSSVPSPEPDTPEMPPLAEHVQAILSKLDIAVQRDVCRVGWSRLEALKRAGPQLENLDDEALTTMKRAELQQQLLQFCPEPAGLTPKEVKKMEVPQLVRELQKLALMHHVWEGAEVRAAPAAAPLQDDSKLGKKVRKYEEQLAHVDEMIAEERQAHQDLRVRLDGQLEIIQQQAVIRDAYAKDMEDLRFDRDELEDHVRQVQEQGEVLREQAALLREQIRKREEAAAEEEQRVAEARRKAEEQGVMKRLSQTFGNPFAFFFSDS